jgi:hypothetical protein
MSKRPSRGVTSGVGTPTKMTGRDGDLTIRKTREGKILYVKEHGSWHPINTGVDTVKLQKDVDRLIRSVNSIRNDNSPFSTIDTLNVRRDKIKLGTDGTGLTLKNNSGALNIRNEADSADVQLAVGYGGTGLSTFTGADRIIKSTGATTLAATQTLPSTVQGNITSVGTISSGTWQGTAIATTHTAAKCTDANADQTSVNNAASATVLETARDIGGVSFNGSASINLPGVNTAGNQNTSGVAAEATVLETSRTIFGNSFNGSANVSGDAIIGNGSGDATVRGNGNNDLILRTSNSVTTNNQSKITLGDGSSADITFSTPRSIIADKPIGFTHYALSNISGDAATLDFNFGANGNKIRVAFTTASATISEARLVFPTNISGNYTVIVKNHTSAITKNEITLWTSSFGTAGTDKVNVKWPNNTIPSVTESDHSRIDIFSFYWDCNDKIAYGVSTLNFYSS